MIEAAKKAKKKLVCGFQFRFHPATQFITRARDEGQFGNVMFMKCQALRRRGIPNWGVFGRKELQGGGPMIDIGVHVIEMAHYVMGSPRPVAASGNTWTYMGDKPSQVVSMWPNWDYKTYTVEDLAMTVYHQLGINAEKKLLAPGNRPIDIVREGKIRKELIA